MPEVDKLARGEKDLEGECAHPETCHQDVNLLCPAINLRRQRAHGYICSDSCRGDHDSEIEIVSR